MQTILSTIKPVSNDTPKWQCKAWCTFDGTTNVGGFCTIGDSYNVASVTDNGIGYYIITFTNAMANTKYVVVGSTASSGTASTAGVSIVSKTTTTFIIELKTAAALDDNDVNFIVFGS